MTQKNLPTTQKQIHRHREGTCGGPSEGNAWEFEISRCKLLIYRTDKQRDLTAQHREPYSISCNEPSIQWNITHPLKGMK